MYTWQVTPRWNLKILSNIREKRADLRGTRANVRVPAGYVDNVEDR